VSFRLLAICAVLLAFGLLPSSAIAGTPAPATGTAGAPQTTAAQQPLRCLSWGAFIAPYNPFTGPIPDQATQAMLMGKIVNEAGFHCVLMYGSGRDFDWAFQPAHALGVKVIANIGLTGDTTANQTAIAQTIQSVSMYPGTIVRISCGLELGQTLGQAVAEPIIRNCRNQVKAAGITIPVGAIDTWWTLCNQHWPCQPWNFINELDWVGVNAQVWLENHYSGIFPCTPADQAAQFHVGRLQQTMSMYPGKEVILTEFGWPAGPNGYSEANVVTGQRCGVASEANQQLAIQQTLALLNRLGLPAVIFEAFREPWLGGAGQVLGPAGAYFGICGGTGSRCTYRYLVTNPPPRVYMPQMLKK
jgi:exo-beta-1,3-glucanase (GH17 family)